MLMQAQSPELILIGDSHEKAKRLIKEFAEQDTELKYEEYSGWYDGVDTIIDQYSVWSEDDILLINVLVANDKVVYTMAMMPEPNFETPQEEIDHIRISLRGEYAPPGHKYIGNNIYKKDDGVIPASFCTYILLSGSNGNIMSYVMEAVYFDVLYELQSIFVKSQLKLPGLSVQYL